MKSIITYVVQTAGILIPVVGFLALLRKEQNKASTYLMLANISCFVMNGAYLIFLRTEVYEVAGLAFQMQYFGNVLFYIFFGLFVTAYLKVRFPRWILFLFVGLQGAELAAMWSGNFGQDEVFRIQEIYSFGTDLGILRAIRYCLVCLILLWGVFCTAVRIFRTRVWSEKNNLAKLACAQIGVMVPLSLMLMLRPAYDIVPIFDSLSILTIILGVVSGDFFSITDMGHEWVFSQMGDAVLIVDSMYGYLDANACAKAVFPELEKQTRNVRVPEALYRIMTDAEDEAEIGGRYYEKKITAILQKNKVAGYILLLVDVTRQRELIEELRAEKEKAEDANRAKSAFMSNMSHEIRTPMNAIVGMTEIMLRDSLPGQEKEYLYNIKNSGNALLTIINDILDFSKIESGKLDLIEDEYEPMSMFGDLGMIFLNRIGEKEVELLFDIDPDLPAKLYGDALRLRQVVINIMNNAIKFTDTGYVELAVRIRQIQGEEIELYFSVRDTGMGIKAEDMGKLFSSFQQVDTKKNRYKEGTGLGLAISRQLVEMMGGEIHVESEYGKGSEFSFTIRQKIMDPQRAARPRGDQPVTVSGRMKSEKSVELLKKLAGAYGLGYAEGGEKSDFFFTDCPDLLAGGDRDRLRENHTQLCILQNPMTENLLEENAAIINKPLYSLNFCQTINHDAQGAAVEEERLNFTAPDANVLIVDDNEMNLKVALGLLKPLMMRMDTAVNGKQALELIERNRYDLIFMDHMMPVMDGIEAVEKLRRMEGEYFKKVPVIALTANAIVDAKAEFLNAGMDDFVAKPIQMKEICAKIKKWLPKEYIKTAGGRAELSVEVPEPKLEIEGLDVAEGIRNCGSKELFISLLGDFYKLIDLKAAKLEKCLADGLLRDYTIEVHALKNTARMIGAMELSERFYRMEQYGNEGNREALETQMPEVLALYRSYKPILQKYGMLQEEGKKQVPTKEIAAALRDLESAINGFDLDGADEAMKTLEGYRIPEDCREEAEELRAYVADVAMEDILRVAGSLIRKLEADGKE